MGDLTPWLDLFLLTFVQALAWFSAAVVVALAVIFGLAVLLGRWVAASDRSDSGCRS